MSAQQVLPNGDLSPQDAFNAILNQTRYPVVLVGDEFGGLVVRLPFRKDNYAWLRGEEHRKPKWKPDPGHWEVPKSWRIALTQKCIARFGGVIVMQTSPKEMEKCASACWKATSDVTACECSCGGLNHGSESNPGGFYEINESLAVKWSGGDRLVATFITSSSSTEIASTAV